MEVITFLKNILWAPPLIILLFSAGILFTVRSGFYQFRCMSEMFRNISQSLRSSKTSGISSLMALSTALGGTVGVGSIIGVAYSIAIGGVGSIFWMWISGFIGMMTKYAEVAIAVKYRTKRKGIFVGGAMYALKALGKPKTAVLFAITCVVASVGAGNLAQTNAIAELLSFEGVPITATAAVVAILLAFIIFKGQKFIAKLSQIVVPFISVLYLLAVTAVIIVYFKGIPSAICRIFSEAFGFSAVAGGFSGAIISSAFRNGLTKGVFSHEAGMGSSPIAHAASETATPHTQGLWGIFEVFFDTFVVSTLTAIAIICVGVCDMGELFDLFLGNAGSIFILAAIAVFAFAAVLSWCFYAESCLYFLSNSPVPLFIYRVLFIIAAFIGAVIPKGVAWDISDIFNALMIFPNLFLLLICQKEVIKIIKLR
ncbi:MAG: hypothetical protein A2Y17_11705 [Clostridiales bacterium GWF2_38_85]|nr:MAG: hypothetical protein A2Y17_11705 [Clostridiales bacterium GWF2_38_85]HBL85367.1 sodium:alanine symporter family protein [Clostridiales bacterium]